MTDHAGHRRGIPHHRARATARSAAVRHVAATRFRLRQMCCCDQRTSHAGLCTCLRRAHTSHRTALDCRGAARCRAHARFYLCRRAMTVCRCRARCTSLSGLGFGRDCPFLRVVAHDALSEDGQEAYKALGAVLPVLLLRHLLNRHHSEPHATAVLPLHPIHLRNWRLHVSSVKAAAFTPLCCMCCSCWAARVTYAVRSSSPGSPSLSSPRSLRDLAVFDASPRVEH